MFRRITVATLVATVALLVTDPVGFGWGGTAPASAHDQLISSSPAPDERLAAAPAEVRLEFTAAVLDVGALVLVVDDAGTDWVAGPPVIDGTVVTVPLLPDLPEAGYQVRWRVVSSDGHPISGFIPFTIGDAAPLELEVGGELPEERAAQAQNQQEQDAIGRTVLIGAGGAAAALAVLALVTALRHARRTRRPESRDGETTLSSGKDTV